MSKMKTVTTALATFTLLTGVSFSSLAMDKYVESSLIEVCKTAKSNKILKFTQTTKHYRLKNKTVAMKVMCNGDDIIDFAEKHGAYKTAKKLKKSIRHLGNVDITDVAKVEKINVNFKE